MRYVVPFALVELASIVQALQLGSENDNASARLLYELPPHYGGNSEVRGLISPPYPLEWVKSGHEMPDPKRLSECIERLYESGTSGHCAASFSECETKDRRLQPLDQSERLQPHFWRSYTPAEMASVLENRTVVFLGDSIMSHTHMYMTCAIAQYAGKFEKEVSRHCTHTKVRFPKTNTTLEFIGGSGARRNSSRHAYNLAEEFPRVFKSLGPRDLIQVNVGVHDSTFIEMITDETDKNRLYHEEILLGGGGSEPRVMMEASSEPRRAMMEASGSWAEVLITEDLVTVAQSVARTVVRARSLALQRPMVFWRETTPQHFESSNGIFTYPSWTNAKCGKMTQARREGRGLLESDNSTSCFPECQRANLRNELANVILEQARVPVIKVWEALAPFDQDHCMGGHDDCTHWSKDVYHFLTEAFINAVVVEESSLESCARTLHSRASVVVSSCLVLIATMVQSLL